MPHAVLLWSLLYNNAILLRVEPMVINYSLAAKIPLIQQRERGFRHFISFYIITQLLHGLNSCYMGGERKAV